MENENQSPVQNNHDAPVENKRQTENKKFLPISILLSAFVVAAAWIYTSGPKATEVVQPVDTVAEQDANSAKELEELEENVLPLDGVTIPIKWGNLGTQMIDAGVIDKEKFEEIYSKRGGFAEDQKKLLYGADNGEIKMTEANSGFLLNLFWAFGLANKNEILEKGPMVNYDGKEPASPAEAMEKAGRFASTGGWSLATSDAMNYYSKYPFVALTPEQQGVVERVSKNIYRPCCGNSTYFPDCNHGMAMLGLVELMAAQGMNEDEMYKIALRVNSYWFPDTYLTIERFFKRQRLSENPRKSHSSRTRRRRRLRSVSLIV
ncbi:MAG: hypothetical protein UX53_C0052G0006 [Candidatus Azambacteria bacterium GW2011_GWB2_46_37]|uniref:Uncharacterized protein n=1 Tax=Candidatus Azambacteria bacterium GW2011_GWB2_46_37 TaxID=1618618 RepID=A0A0G1PXS6_9BACT|nr:MAG: hypothetical protein UX53_C0052G0006 [Candidatus Azambacteria bacterium GW2011_GWB2_46_37]